MSEKEEKEEMPKSKPKWKDWHWDRYKQTDLVSSYFVDQRILFGIRGFFTLYFTFVLFWGIVDPWNEGDYFIYFTDWSFLLLTLYINIVTYYSFQNVFLKTLPIEEPLNKFQIFAWILMETIFAASMMLDIVFWLLLFDGSVTFYTINAHSINLVFIFLELFLNSLDCYLIHVVFLIIYGVVYVIFSEIWQAITQVPVYFFFKWAPVDSAYVIGIFFLGILFYFISFGFFSLKNYLYAKSRNH